MLVMFEATFTLLYLFWSKWLTCETRQEMRREMSKGIITQPQPNLIKVELGYGWVGVGLVWGSAISKLIYKRFINV